MTFFDFGYVTDPPDDEFVDEATQMNTNWDNVDTRLNQFQQEETNTIADTIPVGTEALHTLRIPVWNGTGWVFESSIPLGWQPWIDLPLWDPVVERPGFTPKYRVNTTIGKVMLSGGCRSDVDAGSWPKLWYSLTLDDLTGIPPEYKPVHNCIQPTATGIGTVEGEFAFAHISIEDGSPNSVQIRALYQGDDVGGNFVMLDGVSWWYI